MGSGWNMRFDHWQRECAPRGMAQWGAPVFCFRITAGGGGSYSGFTAMERLVLWTGMLLCLLLRPTVTQKSSPEGGKPFQSVTHCPHLIHTSLRFWFYYENDWRTGQLSGRWPDAVLHDVKKRLLVRLSGWTGVDQGGVSSWRHGTTPGIDEFPHPRAPEVGQKLGTTQTSGIRAQVPDGKHKKELNSYIIVSWWNVRALLSFTLYPFDRIVLSSVRWSVEAKLGGSDERPLFMTALSR